MKRELGEYFRIEGRELCADLARGLLDMEKEPKSSELLGRCFRLAHTLKGAARMARQAHIGELAHAIEDTLSQYRETGGAIPREIVSDLLAIVETIRMGVDEPKRSKEGAPEERLETVRVDISAMDALFDDLSEVGVRLFSLRTGSEALLKDKEAVEALERIERDLDRARNLAAALRLVPVSAIFAPLELAAREAAEALGKEVIFDVDGGSIRIEGQILSAARDALLHMVRNAVDHGIEEESERVAAGKNRTGIIRLEVERKARRVIFRIIDDGRGIDHEAVTKAAMQVSAIDVGTADNLTAEDALALIFHPGVSTRDTVTGISGRGVGLDVVRTTAQSLRGAVGVHSVRGRGTTLSLEVPVSLTSLPVLAVATARETVLIPLDGVRGTQRINPVDIIVGPDGPSLLHEGRALPFVALERVLGWADLGAPRIAVIVQSDERLAAFGGDRLLGILDVMVKPLPPSAGMPIGVLGAAFDTRGDPLLVLDPRGLLNAKVAILAPTVVPQPSERKLPILVIDDSLTTRMLEQSILESAGYEVELAASAEEGLRLAGRRRFGLFIVDIEMPGMNGLDFTIRTRADSAVSAIPVVLVSSLASPDDRRRGIEAGAAAYIVKSEFDQRQFIAKVAELSVRS